MGNKIHLWDLYRPFCPLCVWYPVNLGEPLMSRIYLAKRKSLCINK